MRPEAIFAPVLAFSFLVFVLWLRLGWVRIAGVRRGVVSMEYIALGGGPPPPDDIAVVHHHYSNLFEIPVLFYAACISVYVVGAVDGTALALAWLFVGLRLVHTLIVLATNNPRQRVIPFVLSGFVMWALWFLVFMRTVWSA